MTIDPELAAAVSDAAPDDLDVTLALDVADRLRALANVWPAHGRDLSAVAELVESLAGIA